MHNEESDLTIDIYGHKRYKNKAGKLHRIDGPAVEMGGYKVWYHCGARHRIDGPAVYDGEVKQFYLRGQYFETKEAFFEALTDKEKEIALFSEAFLNA